MKDFNDLTNEQLDEIYYNTIGYRPIAEDNADRKEIIEILSQWTKETEEDLTGIYTNI